MDPMEDMSGMDMEEMDHMDMDDMSGQSPGMDEMSGVHEMDDMDDGMMDEMDEDMEGDDESIDFEQDPAFAHLPPLDKNRKIRRDIIRSVNDVRESKELPTVFVDHIGNKVATEYAEYLLDNNEDPAILQEIIDKNFYYGDVQCLIGEAYLDDDPTNDEKELYNCYMDAHGLLFELQDELQKICTKENTHVAIGFAFNQRQVKVVELFSSKYLMVSQVSSSEDEGVDVRGQMLSNERGIFAVRIVALNNMKKDVKLIVVTDIQFDRSNKTFIGTIPGPCEDVFYSEDVKCLEIYVRKNPDKIQYGKPLDYVFKLKDVELCMRVPMEFIPDPRTIIEDAHDHEKEERDRELRAKAMEEERILKEAEKIARREERRKIRELIQESKATGEDVESIASSTLYSEKSASKKSKGKTDDHSTKSPNNKSERGHGDDTEKSQSEHQSKGKSGMPGDDSDDDDDDDKDEDGSQQEDSIDEMAELPSHQEMKRELIIAINEAKKEHETLEFTNDDLSKQIILMDSNFENYER